MDDKNSRASQTADTERVVERTRPLIRSVQANLTAQAVDLLRRRSLFRDTGLPDDAIDALLEAGFVDPLQLVKADQNKLAAIRHIGPRAGAIIRAYVARADGGPL